MNDQISLQKIKGLSNFKSKMFYDQSVTFSEITYDFCDDNHQHDDYCSRLDDSRVGVQLLGQLVMVESLVGTLLKFLWRLLRLWKVRKYCDKTKHLKTKKKCPFFHAQ